MKRAFFTRVVVTAIDNQRIPGDIGVPAAVQSLVFGHGGGRSFHSSAAPTHSSNGEHYDGGGSIAEPMAHALDTIHSFTGLPWWVTLMSGGATLRMAMFPLSRKAQQATAHVVSAMRDDTLSASSSSPGERMALMRQKAQAIMAAASPNQTSPLWMVASPVIQASVLVYGLYSVRYMARREWAGFDVGGPPWATDLTLPAIDWMTTTTPLGVTGIVMPALLMLGLHASLWRIQPPDVDPSAPPLSDGEQIRRWMLSKLGLALEILTIPVLFGVLAAPQAPLYYWTTSIYTSLALQHVWPPQQTSMAMSSAQYDRDLSLEAKALLQKAASYVADSSPKEALPVLRQVMLLHPNHPSPLLALAQVSASQQDWRMAKEYYQKAANVTEDRLILQQKALFGLGIALTKLGEVDAALIELQHAVSLRSAAMERRDANSKAFEPIAVRALVSMATLHHSHHHDTDKAIDLLTQASQLDPRIRDTFLEPLRRGRDMEEEEADAGKESSSSSSSSKNT
ncbi:ALBINO3-like protein 3 [Picochlorum sp. SENEW3]|nr:ALBINO3-like protein 3 [Picochlorum sp. SENEW3]